MVRNDGEKKRNDNNPNNKDEGEEKTPREGRRKRYLLLGWGGRGSQVRKGWKRTGKIDIKRGEASGGAPDVRDGLQYSE